MPGEVKTEDIATLGMFTTCTHCIPFGFMPLITTPLPYYINGLPAGKDIDLIHPPFFMLCALKTINPFDPFCLMMPPLGMWENTVEPGVDMDISIPIDLQGMLDEMMNTLEKQINAILANSFSSILTILVTLSALQKLIGTVGALAGGIGKTLSGISSVMGSFSSQLPNTSKVVGKKGGGGKSSKPGAAGKGNSGNPNLITGRSPYNAQSSKGPQSFGGSGGKKNLYETRTTELLAVKEENGKQMGVYYKKKEKFGPGYHSVKTTEAAYVHDKNTGKTVYAERTTKVKTGSKPSSGKPKFNKPK